MNLKRLARTLAGLTVGLALVSVATGVYSSLAMRDSAALLGGLSGIILGLVAGICVVAALLRWWWKRRVAHLGLAPQDGWPPSAPVPWIGLSAGAWGVLAACALCAAVFPAVRIVGPCAALVLSAMAGWCHPAKLLRYVGSASLTVIAALAAGELLLGFPGIFGTLMLAPIVLAYAVPAGALMFIAGAFIRHIAT